MIHGAWHGGWSFDPLRPLLEKQGHRLIAPTLPGMGSGDATLDAWADFAADLAKTQSEPVILCGHSRGGIVISQAAERSPDAFSALVYIAAFLLPAGKSFVQEVDAHPRDPAFQNAIRPSADGRSLTIDADVAQSIFYNTSPPGLAAEACARLLAEPIAPALQPLSISADRYGRIRRFYIECARDRTLPPADQRSMYQAAGCERVIVIDSDHSPFLSASETLAGALCDIAAGLANPPG